MHALCWSLLAVAVAASGAGAQKVLLELRPRAGDTVRMELEQVTEMRAAPSGGSATQVTTTLRMFSRAIVESTAHIASLILAITDSVSVSSNDPHAGLLGAQAERDLEGRQMRLRLWPDGAVTLNDGSGSVPAEVRELVSVMPGSFPSRPVAVGETWLREMPVPAADAAGIPAGNVVRARFRLDSLSSDGDAAYVTLSGALAPVASAASTPDASTVSGSVSGRLVVDRRRGWLSESHFLIQLRSTLARGGPTKGDALRFIVTVTQTMRAQPATKRAERH